MGERSLDENLFCLACSGICAQKCLSIDSCVLGKDRVIGENGSFVMCWPFVSATELARVATSSFLVSVEEWLDIDMSLKGICKSIDETLAMRGVVHLEACQFLQAFSLAELVHPESAPATVIQ